MTKCFKILLAVQGLYTLLTALWGLLHIESFMLVTGPKTDLWLVKTVSVLLVVIALTLLSFLKGQSPLLPPFLLGSLTALGMSAIDVYYWAIGAIRWVYLLDAAVELAFFLTWLLHFLTIRQGNRA